MTLYKFYIRKIYTLREYCKIGRYDKALTIYYKLLVYGTVFPRPCIRIEYSAKSPKVTRGH